MGISEKIPATEERPTLKESYATKRAKNCSNSIMPCGLEGINT